MPVEAAAAAPLRELDEFDISGEWEAVAASQVAVAEVALPEAVLPEMGPPEVARPAFDFEEAAAEIDFYVNHGLVEGARKVVARLEEKFPGDPQVAESRQRLEAPTAAGTGESPEAAAALVPNPIADLAKDLASSWAGMEGGAPQKPAPPSVPTAPVSMPDFAVSLGALLGELGSEPSGMSNTEDPQTHYQLGVAFREMGMVEEAIGEFQRVVRTVRRGTYPPQYLFARSLLRLCFLERRLPKLAIQWYSRARVPQP